ncbi:hypothetical protein QJS66_22995 [Kocuria rhizophila]|nr:hypothetical protein QJS66_22995 [Kocuria rhizophila]
MATQPAAVQAYRHGCRSRGPAGRPGRVRGGLFSSCCASARCRGTAGAAMNIPVTSEILGLVLAWGLWLVWVAVKAGNAELRGPDHAAAPGRGAGSGIHTTASGAHPRRPGRLLTGAAGSVVMAWILERAGPAVLRRDVLARRVACGTGRARTSWTSAAEQVLCGRRRSRGGGGLRPRAGRAADVHPAVVPIAASWGPGRGSGARDR